MKKIIKVLFSSSITLTLWFYFDNMTDKIKAVFFPKNTILKEIYKETLDIEEKRPKRDDSHIHMFESKQKNTWLDYLDYILWGDEEYKEKLKSEGIWETFWKPYITSEPKSVKEVMDTQAISAHQAVLDTDEEIKNTAIKSANHVQSVMD